MAAENMTMEMVDDELARLKRKKMELEEKEMGKKTVEINRILTEWQKKIKEVTPGEIKPYVLKISPPVIAHRSSLQNHRGSVKLSKDGVWDFATYFKNDGGCDPIFFSADTREELEPPGGLEEKVTLYQHGINWEIIDPNVQRLKEVIQLIDDKRSKIKSPERMSYLLSRISWGYDYLIVNSNGEIKDQREREYKKGAFGVTTPGPFKMTDREYLLCGFQGVQEKDISEVRRKGDEFLKALEEYIR